MTAGEVGSTCPQEVFRFKGFPKPKQNWSKLPNELFDYLHAMGGSKLKVLLYILRHTWGYQEYDIVKRVSLDEFQRGRRRIDGTRLDGGTGLSKNTVRRALKELVLEGFLDVVIHERDGARVATKYKLVMR